MTTPETSAPAQHTTVKLPPLILHPFADAASQSKLVESSKAGMVIEGLLPDAGRTRRELDRALMEGRYCELRMLFYVGRDLLRWIEQCLEMAERQAGMFPEGVCRQSFAGYLVNSAPARVLEKLDRWGVRGHQRIFARALALNLMFSEAPEAEILTDEFIRHHHQYADQIFALDQSRPYPVLSSDDYEFDLYASGEYSRILERQWEE
jgi:hypothetical protein